jgi:hypothetical protein
MKVHFAVTSNLHRDGRPVLRFAEFDKKAEGGIIRKARKAREFGPLLRKDRRLGMVTEQFIPDRAPLLPSSKRFGSPNQSIQLGDGAPPTTQFELPQGRMEPFGRCVGG